MNFWYGNVIDRREKSKHKIVGHQIVYDFAVKKVARRRTYFIMIFTTAGFPSSEQFRNEN